MEINNKRFITYCAGDKNPDDATLLLLLLLSLYVLYVLVSLYVHGHIYKRYLLSVGIFGLKDQGTWLYYTTAFEMQYLFVLRPMRNHKQILCDNIVQSCDPAQCPKK